MKRCVVLLIAALGLWAPHAQGASDGGGSAKTEPFIHEGRVDEYDREDLKYPIGDRIFHFPEGIVVEGRDGEKLTFDDIKYGAIVRVVGQKTIRSDDTEEIAYEKIIILERKSRRR